MLKELIGFVKSFDHQEELIFWIDENSTKKVLIKTLLGIKDSYNLTDKDVMNMIRRSG